LFNQRNELVFVSFADKDAKKYFPGQLNSFFSLGAHGKKPALFGDEAIDDWFLEICWCFESLALSSDFWTLFQKYVFNQFQAVIGTWAESQPRDKISPWTTALPEIPPAPLYQRGVGGDFRDKLALQNSLPNLESLDVVPAYRLITYF
jgi:hypothetical protein